MSDTFSQADLDALLGDLGTFSAEAKADDVKEAKADTKEQVSADQGAGEESLTQDQIDELLRQFLE